MAGRGMLSILTFLAIVATGVCGFFVAGIDRSAAKGLERNARESPQLQQTHDTVEIVEDETDIRNMFEGACAACALNGDITSARESVRLFQFQSLIGSLEAICPLDRADLHRCAQSTCQPIHKYGVRMVHVVLGWACTNIDRFRAGTRCWTDTFATRMTECTHFSSDVNHFERLTNCFNRQLQTLRTTCTAEARNLFREFFTLVMTRSPP